MTTVQEREGSLVAYCKGAAGGILRGAAGSTAMEGNFPFLKREKKRIIEGGGENGG